MGVTNFATWTGKLKAKIVSEGMILKFVTTIHSPD